MQFELLIGFAGLAVTVLASIASLAYWLGRRFAGIDGRFARIDERFERIDKQFELIDERFEQMDERFAEIGRRIEDEVEGLRNYIDLRISRLAEAFTSYQEFFVEYLASEGILTGEKATLLKGEARRIMRLSTLKSLTKEDWRRIGELLEKDELSLEEALELRKLARKVVKEHGEHPEAWKLHIYASIKVGEAIRRSRVRAKT